MSIAASEQAAQAPTVKVRPRYRRKPAAGAERARRDAWGATWSQVAKELAAK